MLGYNASQLSKEFYYRQTAATAKGNRFPLAFWQLDVQTDSFFTARRNARNAEALYELRHFRLCVCLSVCLFVCHTPVLCQNDGT